GAQGNGGSFGGTISDDGNRVAFASFSDNLVPGDTNVTEDIFVHDRGTGATVRVSVASDGTQGDNMSFEPDLNGDGHLVAYSSFASNLVGNDTDTTAPLFVHDLAP